MKKSEMQTLRQYVGDLDAIFGIKDYTYNDGPARGMRALDVKNGKGLEMTLVADRGLDIPALRYKGVNISFAGKPGLRSPALYTEDAGRGFLKQFYAGMLTTCGITYAGAACEDGGRKLGLHGNYDNTPAAKVAYETVYEGDEAILRLRGEVREACVFEENMLLTREVRIHTEKNVYQVIDRVENQGFEPTPMMLIYHINFGHPLLDEGARIYVNSGHVEPRDDLPARASPSTTAWRPRRSAARNSATSTPASRRRALPCCTMKSWAWPRRSASTPRRCRFCASGSACAPANTCSALSRPPRACSPASKRARTACSSPSSPARSTSPASRWS